LRTRHIDFIKSTGADKALDYTDRSSLSRLETYDMVLDAVDKAKKSEPKSACQKPLTDQGNYVSIDDDSLILSSQRLASITELIENGRITPVNDRCCRFDQIVDAHKYVELGHKKGNVAITVNSY
jgi:NADPH:quinone reductase-like Zn-dependent oxidoreductase